ncbi:MAG TPA: response regulator, partial [Actinomycetota bacterium]|nr:response regulator [Actinomycetota bacterium]
FTQEGEVVLTVSSEPGRASGRHRITFSVRDTGIGIPQDRMEQLFESFSQVDASTTRRYGGTGLGLAISRRLVELMDGSMWAESAVGEGSTFWFAAEMEAAELPSRPFELANAPELGGKQVLVVDDNATNRQILSRQMSSWGMQVRETGSPEEALGWVRGDGRFDLAIVDMQMPEMDGVMLASEIRRVRGDLPLVLLSSLGGAVDVPAEAFVASLTKPVRPSQLYEALLDVVGAGIEEAASPDVGDMGPEVAAGHPLRILLVEDNAVNQQLALLLLQKLGYRADVAANGVEALEALERQTYDAVLMDVEMPEMDGLEATQRIRERSSEGPHVIAVTANALQGERERCLAAGMNDYITKPLRIEDLAAALGRSPRADEDGSASAVDVEVLRRLAASLGEGGGEAVRGLIETFRTNAPELLASLRRGVGEGDPETVRVAAHTLKSNAAMFGASALAEVSRQVEASASEGTLEDGARFIDGIASELGRVTAELERLGPELEP